MINSIINQRRQRQNKYSLQSHPQQKQPPQTDPSIFQTSELMLITIINLILLTVQLTIFNIFFLVTFITSSLKFYKTYIMQKHVDQLEIPHVSTQTKTSIFVHLLAKFIHGVLTEKDLIMNILYFAVILIVYVAMKWVPFYCVVISIVNVEYIYCLKKRWKKRIINDHIEQIKRSIPPPINILFPSSIKQTKITSYSKGSQKNLLYSPQAKHLKPIGQAFGQINMQKSIQSNISSNDLHYHGRSISMIEEEDEQKGQFDEDLPQISSQKIVIFSKNYSQIAENNQCKQSNDENQQMEQDNVRDQEKMAMLSLFVNKKRN